VIIPDIILNKSWKKHFRPAILFALIPAMMVYMLPFWASIYFDGNQYGQNGLMLVYRENVMRYFQPFDHEDPVYAYLVYLPLYLLPWTVFFIPALLALKLRWKRMSVNSKWLVWSVAILFIFFTLSGSRRNYYILPVVPFAILLTADWILSGAETLKRNRWAGRFAAIFFVLFFISFDIGQWAFYSGGGKYLFAEQLKQRMNEIKPGTTWQFVMLDPESKIRFYLGLSPDVKNYGANENNRKNETAESLLKAWPFLRKANLKKDTIYLSRKEYEKQLQTILTNYTVMEETPVYGERIKDNQGNRVIAFIPKT
jgi:hypothetical protein